MEPERIAGWSSREHTERFPVQHPRRRRTFVYRPPESDGPDFRSRMLSERLRAWFFSPIGAIAAWFLVAALLIPTTGLLLLMLPEHLGQLTAGFGLWLVLGLAVIHWWIPSGRRAHRHAEGLAVAGWHVLTSAAGTGMIAWIVLPTSGLRPAFTAGDVPPIAFSGGTIMVMMGISLTLLRGYPAGRGLRYAWTMLCMLGVWMSLWLVAAHGGL